MNTPTDSRSETIRTLFSQLRGFAVCNCPEDDEGRVSYHSNCHRHARPLLDKLEAEVFFIMDREP